jgi:L-lactate dehydrogenase (cytochrome)
MPSINRFLNLHDFERGARRALPRPIWGYVANAAEDGKALRANRDAFDDYALVPRTLNDVSNVSLETSLFGQSYGAPFGIAPMGIVALSGYRGDTVFARAARAANIPMMLSGSSLVPMEEVGAVTPNGWFQLYMPETNEAVDALLERVARAGFTKLVVTVDYAAPPNPENNIRSGFSSPLRPRPRLALDGLLRPRWLLGTFFRTLVRHGMPHFENLHATRGLPIISRHVERDFSGRTRLNWNTLAYVRERWQGKLMVKGILHTDDARRAVDTGTDGLIVSNHGGRQLDTAVAPLRMLPDIVKAAGERPVMVDSGVRRGTDVLKALALGARFVFLGRPFNYALACAGEPGVARAIYLLSAEIRRDMALLGITRTEDMTRERLLETRAKR